MVELVSDLAIWKRSKAGRAFGPATLRGQRPIEPDARLSGFSAVERIEQLIREDWIPLHEIADRADLDRRFVTRTCRRFTAEGLVETREPQRTNGAVMYRRRAGAGTSAA